MDPATLQAIKDFGYPVASSAALGFAVWASLKWIATYIGKPFIKGHLEFLQAVKRSNENHSDVLRDLAAGQKNNSEVLGEIAKGQNRQNVLFERLLARTVGGCEKEPHSPECNKAREIAATAIKIADPLWKPWEK